MTRPQSFYRDESPDFFNDIDEFHTHFNILGRVTPGWMSPTTVERRMSFIREEFLELEKAVQDQDLPEVLDALVDLVYVAVGMAHCLGLPFNDAWREVHNCNMKKMRPMIAPGSDPLDLKITKPEGWEPPDIKGILIRYGWQKD